MQLTSNQAVSVSAFLPMTFWLTVMACCCSSGLETRAKTNTISTTGQENNEAEWNESSKRMEDENKLIERIVEYGDSEACLAWLEQNQHLLGPGHERVDELISCAVEELAKLAKSAFEEGRIDDCKGLVERADELLPDDASLLKIKNILNARKHQEIERR